MTRNSFRLQALRRLGRNWRMRFVLPPALMGLVAFSFVGVAFGAVVYAAAVPLLVQQSPTVQAAVQAVEETDISTAVVEPLAESADQAVTSALASFPSLTLGAVDVPVDSESTTSQEESQAAMAQDEHQDDASQGGSSDQPEASASADEPKREEAEKPAADPVVEEDPQEAAYHARLVEAYNALPSYMSVVSSMLSDYSSASSSGSTDYKSGKARANQQYSQLSAARKQINALDIPESSKWYAQYQAVRGLYGNLLSAAANINSAWTRASASGGWAAGNTWIESKSKDGKLTALIDFEQAYPQVRL